MSAPKMHRCDACGGSGCEDGHGGEAYCVDDFCCCPVCGGRGSLPDQMPASDAIADAATLMMVSGSLTNTRTRSRCRQELGQATQSGLSARFQATSRESWLPDPSWAGGLASFAARHAFTACPGLRKAIQ